MKEANLRPIDESVRLNELQTYEVLDTGPESAYDDITLLASQICQCPIGLVSLVDGERQWFKSRKGLDVSQTDRDVAFCAHAVQRPDELLIVEDTLADERFADNPLVTSEPHIRFYAGAPLTTSLGNALGTLCVIDREPRRLSEQQLSALEALSRQVMAQLELRKAIAQLETQASRMRDYQERLVDYQARLERSNALLEEKCRTDSLTGLSNRRALLERLEDECARAERYRTPLAVAIVDVDHFKGFNDSHGHPAGDEVLRRISQILLDATRQSDLAGRLGGEEFALVLSNTNELGAYIVSERIRKTIAQERWPLSPVTVSIGLTVLGPENPSPSTLLSSADRALYRAKMEGRNRICRASEPDRPRAAVG